MELRSALSEALKSRTPSAATSDQFLVEACLAGNERAWSALVGKYKRLIYSIPVRQKFSPADASDIFQSVCLDLLENLPRLRDATKVKSWLITVTVRKCFHFRQERMKSHITLPPEEADGVIDESSDPARISMTVEREQAIREALEKLSPRCAMLIKHLFFDEPQLSYAKIAERIGVSANTIGSTRERCLEKLRVLLEEAGVSLD